MAITLRQSKQSSLTYADLDNNQQQFIHGLGVNGTNLEISRTELDSSNPPLAAVVVESLDLSAVATLPQLMTLATNTITLVGGGTVDISAATAVAANTTHASSTHISLGTTSTTALAGNTEVNNVSISNLDTALAASQILSLGDSTTHIEIEGSITDISGDEGINGQVLKSVTGTGSNRHVEWKDAIEEPDLLHVLSGISHQLVQIGQATTVAVGVGTVPDTTDGVKLDVNGKIRTTATVLTNSDRSLKEDIKTVEDPLNVVRSLRGVTYKLKSTQKNDIGVIAQEVEEVLPEIVGTDSKGLKSVQYSSLIGVLIEAIKALEEKVDMQGLEIKELKNL